MASMLPSGSGRTGLAGITGTVQRTGGTRAMSGDEIDDFLEARAASVETSISSVPRITPLSLYERMAMATLGR